MPAKKATGKTTRTTSEPMKLAEALILRADYQKRIEQLKGRLLRNAKVQEGDMPAEDPNALLAELTQLTEQLEQVIKRINRTNSSTELSRGRTIADAIAERDVLRIKHAALGDLAQSATITQSRTTRSEVRFKSTVSVAAIQRQADGLAKAHRELDALIQEANWRTNLAK
jgi:DNA-binding ferritin-like protein